MKINLDNAGRIIDDYMPLILKTVGSFPVFEKDEAIDEAKAICIEAIRDYDFERASFGHFLKLRLNYHFYEKLKEPRALSLDKEDEKGGRISDTIASNTDVEKTIIKKESYKDLYEKVSTLGKKDRKILYMYYDEEKSHEQIGKALGLSPKTIRNRKSKAISRLRDMYGLINPSEKNHG